jgi:hypothetical protein
MTSMLAWNMELVYKLRKQQYSNKINSIDIQLSYITLKPRNNSFHATQN